MWYLGRGLWVEEAEYVMEMAGRTAALIFMQAELGASDKAVKSKTWSWVHGRQPWHMTLRGIIVGPFGWRITIIRTAGPIS